MTHERFCSRRVNLGDCDCNIAEAVAENKALRAETEVLRDALDVALRLLDGEGIHAERVDRLAAVLRGEQ